jgi:YVTN family beta-propeller protein
MKHLLPALLLATSLNADTLLVVNKADSTLSFVDVATLQSVATIAVGNAPHEVAASGDGTLAVVANYGTGPLAGTTLSVIDVGSRKEVRRVDLPGLLRPHGIEAVGSKFYLTTEGSRAVARYDAVANRFELISGSGGEVTHMIVVAPGEQKLYTANIGSNDVSVIDLTAAPRAIGVKKIPVVKGPEGIDLAPDGSELWVASRVENGGISVIDPASGSVTKTIATTTKVANRVKFTLDGKRVLVSDPAGNAVLVYDAATKELLTTITMAAGPSGIQLAPDGKRAFVACANAKRVLVIDLETLAIAASIDVGNTPDGLAYAASHH